MKLNWREIYLKGLISPVILITFKIYFYRSFIVLNFLSSLHNTGWRQCALKFSDKHKDRRSQSGTQTIDALLRHSDLFIGDTLEQLFWSASSWLQQTCWLTYVEQITSPFSFISLYTLLVSAMLSAIPCFIVGWIVTVLKSTTVGKLTLANRVNVSLLTS